jgi:predicted transcriptional regulator
LFGIVGFLYNPFLIFIAIFVYLGAQAEAGMTEMQSAMEGLRVRDAMMTRFRTLTTHDTLGRAVEELLAGSQQDFPVLENGLPVGILRRNDLVKALSDGRRDLPVGEVMCRECDTVDESASLKQAVESMQARQCATVPVVQSGRIVGLLTLENISEMIMVNAALDTGTPGPRPARVTAS